MFRQLDEHMLVSGQIAPEDLAEAAAQGVTMVVNNRPDGESPGQPTSAQIETAAKAAGLGYRHIPIAGGFTQAQVEELTDALAQANGTVLAFCGSGRRSTFLWALARSQAGDDVEAIIGKAAAAGYDVTPLRDFLR